MGTKPAAPINKPYLGFISTEESHGHIRISLHTENGLEGFVGHWMSSYRVRHSTLNTCVNSINLYNTLFKIPS